MPAMPGRLMSALAALLLLGASVVLHAQVDASANVTPANATPAARLIHDAFAGGQFDFLVRPGPFQILWWQWIAFPIVALFSWVAGQVLRAIVHPIIGRLTAQTTTTWDDQIAGSIGPPLTLALAIVVFAGGCAAMGLASPALAFVGSFTRAGLAFAFFWALWRSARVLMAWMLTRPWAVNSPSTRSVLALVANILRGVILGIGVLSVIAAFGYPVGTVLAGLGIGGLALAFGAQKTVENVFGSISLAIDQPFRIGDQVRVDNFIGTVEEIGLRSTRFRTEERTLITIPNGKLADQRLESLEARDRLRLTIMVRLAFGTTREQMLAVLAGLESVLRAHPQIWPGGVSVKFKEFGPSSLDIEAIGWFKVQSGDAFLGYRQEVLLEFMRVVEESGTSFAVPTTTVRLVPDTPA